MNEECQCACTPAVTVSPPGGSVRGSDQNPSVLLTTGGYRQIPDPQTEEGGCSVKTREDNGKKMLNIRFNAQKNPVFLSLEGLRRWARVRPVEHAEMINNRLRQVRFLPGSTGARHRECPANDTYHRVCCCYHRRVRVSVTGDRLSWSGYMFHSDSGESLWKVWTNFLCPCVSTAAAHVTSLVLTHNDVILFALIHSKYEISARAACSSRARTQRAEVSGFLETTVRADVTGARVMSWSWVSEDKDRALTRFYRNTPV